MGSHSPPTPSFPLILQILIFWGATQDIKGGGRQNYVLGCNCIGREITRELFLTNEESLAHMQLINYALFIVICQPVCFRLGGMTTD